MQTLRDRIEMVIGSVGYLVAEGAA